MSCCMMAEERSKRDLFDSDLGLSFSVPRLLPFGISGGAMLFSIESRTVWSATGSPPFTPHRYFRASSRKHLAESATLSSFSKMNLMIIVLASLNVPNCSWVTVETLLLPDYYYYSCVTLTAGQSPKVKSALSPGLQICVLI